MVLWSKAEMIAHGLADATATPSSLASLKYRITLGFSVFRAT